MKNNIIVDLDGTLAFEEHRRPLIRTHGWNAYFRELHKDTPNRDLITLLNHLEEHFYIHILTGRVDAVKTETECWLQEHEVPYDTLCMRPQGLPYPDFGRPLSEQTFVTDHQLKQEMLTKHQLTPVNTLMVFDDRNDMVKWWRSLGFSTCQVREEGVHINPLKGLK